MPQVTSPTKVAEWYRLTRGEMIKELTYCLLRSTVRSSRREAFRNSCLHGCTLAESRSRLVFFHFP